MHEEKRHIIIIGGGIIGLASAYIAARAGHRVSIVEGSAQFGGLLNTFTVGGTPLEHYYHHFFTQDSELIWLLRELGIEQDLEFHETSMSVFHDKHLYAFNSASDLLRFKPIHFWDKIRFGLSSIYLWKIADWRKNEDVSALDWLSKWSGTTTVNTLWKPLLNLKFGPYADQVPLSWMIGRLRQRMNSRTKGVEKLGYLRGSLQKLLDRLLTELRNMDVELIPNARVTSLNISNKQLLSLNTEKGVIAGDEFISTIPTPYLAPMLRQDAPKLADSLEAIEYFGVICTVLELDRPLGDTYWINITDEKLPFGGLIEHTQLVSSNNYNNRHIVYLSRYFAKEEDIADMDEASILALMIPAVKQVYPAFDESWVQESSVFKTLTAATVCDLNFSQRVPDCKTLVRNLHLANMSHVYPDERSVSNSIRIAAACCKKVGIKVIVPRETVSLSAQIGFS